MKLSIVPAMVLVLTVAMLSGCGDFSDAPVTKAAHRKPATPKKVVAEPKPPKPVKPLEVGTTDYLDSKYGFRDAAFGQPEGDFSNLVLKEKDEVNQVAIYTRSGDVLDLEGVPLQTIEYIFFKNQLVRVILRWRITYRESVVTLPPSTDVAIRCTSLYGRPKRQLRQKDMTQYNWKGQKISILLDEFRLPGVADIYKNKSGWAIPPITTGQMIIESIALRQEADTFAANQALQKQNGL